MSEYYTFSGTLQSDREIQATRLEDEMFIFTGTYPLIYKGDGNLYMMPDYNTSFTEIANSGHNVMSSNFEKVYRYDEYSELELKNNELNAERFEIIDSDFAPVIPYRLEENGDSVKNPFNIGLSYSLPQKYTEESFGFTSTNYVGSFETLEDANNNFDALNVGDIIYITNENAQIQAKSFYQVSDEEAQDWFFNFDSDFFVKDYNTPEAQTYTFNGNNQELVAEYFTKDLKPEDVKIELGTASSGSITWTTIYNFGNLVDEDYVVSINEVDSRVVSFRDKTQIPSVGDPLVPNFYITPEGLISSDKLSIVRITFNLSLKKVTSSQLGLKPLYEVYPVVYSRFTTPGSLWEPLPQSDYSYDIHSNRGENFNNRNVDNVPLTVRTPNAKLGESLEFINIKFNRLSAEIKDYKVDLVLRKRGYETATEFIDDFGITLISYLSTEFVDKFVETAEYIIEDLETTPTRLEDFPTEEEPDRGGFSLEAIWSANKVLEHFNKLIVYGSLEMPQTAFVSFPENTSYFPAKATLKFNTDLSEPIESIVPFTNILVVQSANRTWGLKGNSIAVFLDTAARVVNENAYQVFDINTSIGTIAPKSVRPVRNTLYFLSNEGIASLVSLYATDDRYNVKLMDRNIENIVPRDKDAIAIQHDNQYWINFPSTNQMFRYYIDKKAWVRDDFSHLTEFKGISKFYRNEGNLRFITKPSRILTDNYEVYEAYVDKSLATDFGLNVPSEFLTADLDQIMPFHEKRFKEVKLDFVIQNEYLPDLTAKPTEGSTAVKVDLNTYQHSFTADLKANHSYKVAYPFGFYIGQAPEDGDYYGVNYEISNLTVTVKGKELSNVGIENGDIYFTLEEVETSISNQDPIVIEFDSNEDFETEWVADEGLLVDFTYDSNINYYVVANSDGTFLNREALDYNYSQPPENLYDLVKFTASTGTRFSNFTFNETPFGEVAKSIQTIRMAGSGYGITVFLKDNSRSKWTLETLGIAYRIRKPRSR